MTRASVAALSVLSLALVGAISSRVLGSRVRVDVPPDSTNTTLQAAITAGELPAPDDLYFTSDMVPAYVTDMAWFHISEEDRRAIASGGEHWELTDSGDSARLSGIENTRSGSRPYLLRVVAQVDCIGWGAPTTVWLRLCRYDTGEDDDCDQIGTGAPADGNTVPYEYSAPSLIFRTQILKQFDLVTVATIASGDVLTIQARCDQSSGAFSPLIGGANCATSETCSDNSIRLQAIALE